MTETDDGPRSGGKGPTPEMSALGVVADYLAGENGLAVISTTQADGRVLSSVVNCGVIDHPLTGTSTVGFVSVGSAARNGHIRRGSEVTVTIRRGFKWLAVTGPADLVGPDDPCGLDASELQTLLRDVFRSAGGEHDDWDEYDRVMAEDRRVAVFVSPQRVLGFPKPN